VGFKNKLHCWNFHIMEFYSNSGALYTRKHKKRGLIKENKKWKQFEMG
jgi:hypothetical protein